MSRSHLRIGEVAQLLGVTPKTVRHYHRRGLIAEPPRSDSDYRLYTAQDLLRLRHIRQLQAMGLSLAQIKAIFDAPDPDAQLQTVLADLRATLQAEQARVAERIQRVTAYLGQESPLSEVVKPILPSPTYAILAEKLTPDLPMTDAMRAFDHQIFAELDSFDWGGDYSTIWTVAARLLVDDPNLRDFMVVVAGRIEAAESLEPDAPEIEQWARELAMSPHLQSLCTLSAPVRGLSDAHYEVMGDLIHATSLAQLTPAQQRLFALLTDELKQIAE
jgi:DNA-binding transcriptional MerR regulator